MVGDTALNFSNLAAAVEKVESGGREDAVSPKGALGPMQTMPGTLRDPGFGVRPAQNNTPAEMRRVGQDYLQAMLQKYGGNLDHALAAYNWGPTNTDRWITAGADPSKLPKETRDYIPKVKAAMGAAATAQPEITGAPTTPVENVAAATRKDPADFYLANAQAIPRDMQLALQGRQELVRMAQLYQQSGMGLEFMQVRAEILKADNNMFYLQGMQGLQELEMANDPRRLATVWSEATGVPVGVQPRTDGNYNVFVNGRMTREGISSAQLADSARSSFDSAFRQQKGAASAAFNEKMQESMLKIQEGNALEMARMIRETTVEGVRGNNARALEYFKANANWDIKPTGAGDGTVVIRPPGSPPYLFNPAGRTIEIDGVKVPANSAILIGGLPLPTQARLNQVR
jgi:soluble lytic murein transglycosylase-like protein